jgi:hypothetical protein
MNGFMTRGRLMLLLVGATAFAAMALPGSAMAGKSHLLKLYKVEQHVDLQGQDDTYNLSCYGQDLALQGMWRVDDVEQDNDFYDLDGPGGSWATTSAPASNDHADWDVLRSVRPTMVQHNGDSSYDFGFTPLSGGDAQLKLWVTCLGKNAESVDGHTVSWALTNATTSGPTTIHLPGAGSTNVASAPCPAGFIAVQPGFRIGTAALPGGDADVTRFESSNGDKTWNWTFDNRLGDQGSGDFIYTTSSSCLELRSGVASSGTAHRHRIVKKQASSYSQPNILATRVSEVQAHCGELYKGMLGGWNYNLASGWSTQLYFLGMDPRIKIRAFKFIDRGGAVPTNQVVSLLCFKDKTT